jgi:DNA-binding NarL/FixJ family response regulator
MTVRVLLVDDHEVVRAGLRAMLELEPDLEVAGEASDGAKAVEQARRLRPDVVLMDVRMGAGVDGIEACRAVKSELPESAVVILTSFGSDEAVLAAIMAGASGFLVKNTGRRELLNAIRSVASGQSLLDNGTSAKVSARLAELAKDAPNALVRGLSDREREVLGLVARGLTNRQIAERLVISELTARNHVSHILEKLGMARRAEAAAFAAQLRLGGDL